MGKIKRETQFARLFYEPSRPSRAAQMMMMMASLLADARKMRRPAMKPTIEKHDFYDHDSTICPHEMPWPAV